MNKILLVDDESLIRMSIRSLGDWESARFEIAGEASNGLEALEQLAKTPDIFIVFADVNIPK